MTSPAAEFIKRQVREFAESSSDEPWLKSPARGFEELVNWARIAVSVYQLIRRIDQHWTAQVTAGRLPLSIEDADAVGHLYEAWLPPASALLRELEPGAGFSAGSQPLLDDLRDAVVYARSALSIPLETVLAPDGPGQRRTIREVRDALKHRVQPQG